MTYTRTCRRCKNPFTAFPLQSSHLSSRDFSGRSKRMRVRARPEHHADAPVDPNERIDQLEKSLEILHTAIDVEVENQVRTKLKSVLKELMDEQLDEMKTLIAVAQSKAIKAERKLEEAMKGDFQDLITRVRAVKKSQTAVQKHLASLKKKVSKMQKDNS